MRLFNEIVINFDDLVTYIETNSHEDFVKCVAITHLVNRGVLPHDNIKQKPIEMVNVLQNNVELDYSKFLQTIYVGVIKTRFGAGATTYDAIKSLENNLSKYIKVYELLDDDLSRKTMFNIILYRLISNQNLLNEIRIDGLQYYIPDLIPEKENGVLLDCGGFDGLTTTQYIETYGDNYKKIYLLEPDPKQFQICKDNTSDYKNIVYLNKGVSDEKSTLKFESSEGSGANRISQNGNIEVDIIALDEEIDEPITFVKMDIEGAEIPALNGCKNHIINDRPHLTICLYHILSDIFIIPLLLNNFDKNYKHNMRFHGYRKDDSQPWQPWEIVLYSTPLPKN